jgi:hypothetical protein
MATLDQIFTALTSFDSAALLNTAMILLDIPSAIFERLPVGL